MDVTGHLIGRWVTGRAISHDPGLLPYFYVDRIDDAVEPGPGERRRGGEGHLSRRRPVGRDGPRPRRKCGWALARRAALSLGQPVPPGPSASDEHRRIDSPGRSRRSSIGQRLDQPTFHERYEAMPPGTWAESLDGVVYMSSPAGYFHGLHHVPVIVWLSYYAENTRWRRGPATTPRSSSTIRSEPQPDGPAPHRARIRRSDARTRDAFVGGRPRADPRGLRILREPRTSGPKLTGRIAAGRRRSNTSSCRLRARRGDLATSLHERPGSRPVAGPTPTAFAAPRTFRRTTGSTRTP